MSGKRESRRRSAPSGMQLWWRQHRAWVAGMSRKQKIRYRLLQALVVVAIVVIALFIGIRAWVKLPTVPELPTEGNEDSSAFDGAELPEVAKSGRKKGVYTFLLVGQDTAGGGNTDTMMLITFDTVNKTIDGMSLPRDTMINVDRRGSGHRLNAVYNYNKGSDKSTQVEKGITALKKEVGKLTGITPDYYVMVQWEAVGKMVDALGGVYFDVPFDMDYDDPTPGQDLHIHLKEGYQKLDGEQAMGLIRWRHNNDYSVQYPNGDLGRIQTQQAFLEAVAAECLKPSTLLKAPALAEVFMENVTTDLSLGNLLAFAELAVGMDAETGVNFVSMPVQDAKYPGVSMVLPVVDELLELLNESFNPYLNDIQSSDLQVLVRNSDGSYSVTSGTLLDTSLNSSRGSSSGSSGSSGGSSQTQELTEPEEPTDTQPEDPGTSGESGSSSSSGSQGGDSSTTEPTDPGTSGNGGDSSQPENPDQSQGGSSSGDGDSQSGSSGGETGGGESGQTGGSEGGNASGETGGNTEPPTWLNPTGSEQAA